MGKIDIYIMDLCDIISKKPVNDVITFRSGSARETISFARDFSSKLHAGDVIAMYGGMGMGKTAFVTGLADGLGIDPKIVSSPTFAIANVYGGRPVLYHFDMYRISSWEDLETAGYFDYLDSRDGIIAVEWSENIENALPEDAIKIVFSAGANENERIIEIFGGAFD